MARRRSKKRSSGKRNNSPSLKSQRGSKYSPGELFMAGCGALILVMLAGIVITSLLGN